MSSKTLCTTLILISLLTLPPFRSISSGAEISTGPLDQSINSVEERRILVSLQKEREKLIAREKLLTAKEMELKSLRAEVDKKLNELRTLKESLQQLLAHRDEEEAKKIRDLGKVYEKMDPQKAASIIPSLRMDLAIGILANMKKKSAAKILNNMDRDKAIVLSRSFSALDPYFKK